SSGVDLRTITGVGAEQVQGNPVSVVMWPPAFSAEFMDDQEVATHAEVEVSLSADFNQIAWSSGLVQVGAVSNGQRTSLIPYTGEQAGDGAPSFWRIRFSSSPEP